MSGKPDPDCFAAKRERLRRAIICDGSLTPTAVKVGVALVEHINSKTGLAWPSADTLANLVHRSTRSVKSARQELIKRGHFELAFRGGGRGLSNRYRALFPSRDSFKTVKGRRTYGEPVSLNSVKGSSPDNLERHSRENLEEERELIQRNAPSANLTASALSNALRQRSEKILRENFAHLVVDDLFASYMKARRGLITKDLSQLSFEDGFIRYLQGAIRLHHQEQNMKPKKSRRQMIASLRQ